MKMNEKKWEVEGLGSSELGVEKDWQEFNGV